MGWSPPERQRPRRGLRHDAKRCLSRVRRRSLSLRAGGPPDALCAGCRCCVGEGLAAGCRVASPIQDQFWGDRYGEVEDPFGFVWAIATHLENLTGEEIEARRKKAFGGGPPSQA